MLGVKMICFCFSAGGHAGAAVLHGGLRRGGDVPAVEVAAGAAVVPRDVPLRAAPAQVVLAQQLHLHGRRHLGRATQGHLLAAHSQVGEKVPDLSLGLGFGCSGGKFRILLYRMFVFRIRAPLNSL